MKTKEYKKDDLVKNMRFGRIGTFAVLPFIVILMNCISKMLYEKVNYFLTKYHKYYYYFLI